MSKYQYLASVILVGACAQAAHAQQVGEAANTSNTAGQENCVVERVQLPDGRYSEVGRCVNGEETGDDDMFDRVTGSLEGAIAQSEQIRHEAMVKSGDYDEARAAILAEAKKVAQMPEGAERDAKEQRLKSLAKTFQSRFGNRGRVNKSVKNVVRRSNNGTISTARGSVDANGRITPAGSGGGAIGGVQPTPAGTPGRNPAGTPGRNVSGGDDLARPQICPPICGEDDLAKPQPHDGTDAKDGRRAENRNGARQSSTRTRRPNPAGTPARRSPLGTPNLGDVSCPAVVPTCGPKERLKKTGQDAAGCTQYQCVATNKPDPLPVPRPDPTPNGDNLACPAVVNKPTCGPREWLRSSTNAAGCAVYECVSMARSPAEPNPAGTRNPNPKGDAKAKKRMERREKREEIREKRMERRKKRMERRKKREEMRKKRMERREKRERRQTRRQKEQQAKSRGGATGNGLINGPDGFRGARDIGGSVVGNGSSFRGGGGAGVTLDSLIGNDSSFRGARDIGNLLAVGGGGGRDGGGSRGSSGPAGGESGLGGARGGALGDGSRGSGSSSSSGPTGGESGLGGARGGALGDGSRGSGSSSSSGPTGGDSGLGGARGGALGDGSRGGGSDGGGSDGGGSDGGGSDGGGGSGGAGGAGDR